MKIVQQINAVKIARSRANLEEAPGRGSSSEHEAWKERHAAYHGALSEAVDTLQTVYTLRPHLPKLIELIENSADNAACLQILKHLQNVS